MNILTNEERQALANALTSSVSTPTSSQGGSTNHFMNHHANV
jgi:hypothetical protein